MSPTTRIVLALFLGLGLGAGIAATGNAELGRLVDWVMPVGTLWVNALRMTVIPLIFAVLVTGIVSAASAATAGALAARSLWIFAVFLLVAAAATAIATPLFLQLAPIPSGATEALRAGAARLGVPPPAVAPFSEWIGGLVPVNPIAAAAQGAVLPLIVFALFFAFAITRIEAAHRTTLTNFFRAIADTMIVIVRWVIAVAPFGVFALAMGVGFHGGLHTAGALLYYIVLISFLCLMGTAAMYPVAAFLGGTGWGRFAQAAAPAQVVAISTQSSLATLPAMMVSATKGLGIREEVAGVTLPLAVSVFRVSTVIANLGVAIFVAYAYGIPLGPAQLATGAVVSVVTSIGSVGVSSQVSFFFGVAPICLAMGVPIEVLPLLLAVEVLPDIFRTICNVTADLAASSVIARRRRRR